MYNGLSLGTIQDHVVRLIQCRFVTTLVKLIYGAVTGQHGALKTGDCLPHIFNHDIAAKYILKEFPIARNLSHLGDHFVMVGKSMLNRVVERPDGLIFQCVCTTISKLCFTIDAVKQDERATTAFEPINPGRDRHPICKALLRQMAARTGDRVVLR